MTEAQHQRAVIQWSQQPHIREKWPELALLHHVPNGGRRDVIEARHLKETGVRSGVPDLHLPVARGSYHALWIEMKTETGRASAEQKWWIGKLNEQGSYATVCHGWKEAVRTLEWYMEGAGSDG